MHIARWAHMHRCLSAPITPSAPSKACHCLHIMSANGHGVIVLTGRAPCHANVKLHFFNLISAWEKTVLGVLSVMNNDWSL